MWWFILASSGGYLSLTILTWQHLSRLGITATTTGPIQVVGLFVMLCVLPTLIAWAVAEFVQLASPRRLFDPRAQRAARATVCGLLVVGLSVPVIAILLSQLDPVLPDAVSVTIGSSAATLAVLLVARRTPQGLCIHCGYDITRSIDFGRCPECGTPLSWVP